MRIIHHDGHSPATRKQSRGEFDWPAMGPELSAYGFGLHDRVDTFLATYSKRLADLSRR